jgi:hypothetical protein
VAICGWQAVVEVVVVVEEGIVGGLVVGRFVVEGSWEGVGDCVLVFGEETTVVDRPNVAVED